MRGLAGISVLAQIVGLLSVAFLIFDLATLPESLIEQGAGNNELISKYFLETVASYTAWLGVGIFAALVAWMLILKDKCRDAWFLRSSRVLAWSWMPLIPIGTLVGVLVLSARAAAIADEESQP